MQYNSSVFPMTQMQPGIRARVKALNCSGSIRRRLQDIGLIEGTPIRLLFRRSSKSLGAYSIRGATIALRPSESDQILVTKEETP